MGHLSARDSMWWVLGKVPLLGNPKDEVFERYAKCPKIGPLCIRALLGSLEGVRLPGLLSVM